ncbi:MAG: CAP domain-containing protein [Gemmataceae bacterium]
MRRAPCLLLLLVFAVRADETPRLATHEQTLLDLLNKERRREKLPALTVHPLLTRAARLHAENMARQEKFSHALDGKSVAMRVTDLGYDYRAVGENLALAEAERGGDPPPPAMADVHQHWMDSRSHRANILGEKFREVGLATARSKAGTYYYVQVFGVSRK